MLFLKHKTLAILKKLLKFLSYYEYFNFKVRKINGPIDLLKNQAALESYEFLKSIKNKYFICDSPNEIRKLVIEQINKDGYILEFGVHKGNSINFFHQNLSFNKDKRKIYGFDSFRGLEEDWHDYGSPKKRFNSNGKISFKVKNNIELIVGDIRETLSNFLEKNKPNIAFVHMDLDTYSITKYTLEKIEKHLMPGAIILFDEFYNYPNWKDGEFKALQETYSKDKFIFFAASNQNQIAIKIN